MIRAVIFDFNGVLVDDEPLHFALFREILGQHGIELTEHQYYAEYLGYDDRGCFEAALRDAGRETDPYTIDALIARKARRYEALAATELRFFPGAAEVVEQLARRWPVAVCSGALRTEIELALRQLGVRQHVVAIVSAEDTTRCKPDPEGYLHTLSALREAPLLNLSDLEPASCLVIEDSLAGIEAARAAGMRVVGVTHTYPADLLRDAGAEQVVDRLSDVNPA